MMRYRWIIVVGSSYVTAVVFVCGIPATAAQPVQSEKASPIEPDIADDIVVQGDRIHGTAIGALEPIAVLDANALHGLGAISMSDLLKRLKGAAGSSSGADPAILLNGRRISGFAELQSLPPEAIERVEILSEQDATRFGFAPTSRVINFVTKKHFRSVALQQLAGTTTDGGGAMISGELNTTRIDGDRRFSLSSSYLRQNPVLQNRRKVAPDPESPFAIGGNITGADGKSIDPALDALAGRPVVIAALPYDSAARRSLPSYLTPTRPITDLGPYRTLQPRTHTIRIDGTVASPLGKDVNASLNLSVQFDRTRGLNGLASGVLTAPASAGLFPFTGPVFINRYFPGVILHQNNNALVLHGATTIQGGAGSWAWNITGSYDRSDSRAISDTGIELTDLQAAIDASGDPLRPLDPASARRIVNRNRALTNILSTKAVVSGPLAHLPAGDVQVTISAGYNRASGGLRGNNGGLSLSKSMTLNSPSFDRSISNTSINLDVPIASAIRDVLPFAGQLGVNAMLDFSDVSGFGRLRSFNLGFNWSPVRRVQLIGSVNDTRTAPVIAQLFSPILKVPNTPVFDYTTGTSVLATTITGGNPDLAPERRKASTIGLALQPVKNKNIRLTFDYVDTLIDNRSATIGNVTAPIQSAFPDRFVRSGVGSLINVDLRPINLARERERKLRLTLNAQLVVGHAPPPVSALASSAQAPAARPSVFTFTTFNYRLEDRLTLRRGLPTLDLLDGATIDGTGGRPRWDVDGTVGSNYGAVNFGVSGRLQGPTRIRSELGSSDLRFSGRTSLDLYSLIDIDAIAHRPWAKQLSLQFTVENLLNDRINVRDRTGRTPNRFQAAFIDPLGRSVRLSVRKLF